MQAQSTSNNNHHSQEVTTMQCDKVWDLLSVFADGETDPHETALVQAHISVCADCARDLQFMQGTHQVLQDVPEVEPPASLRSAILAATVGRPTLTERLATAVRRTLTPAPVRYGALAAAGAAAALTAISLRDGNNPVQYVPSNAPVVANAPAAPETGNTLTQGPELNLIEVYDQPKANTTSSRRVRRQVSGARQVASVSQDPRATHTARRSNGALNGTRSATAANTKQPTLSDDLNAPEPANGGYGASYASDPEPPTRVIASGAAASMETSPEAPATPAADRPAKIILTASAAALDPNQVATLAELRRSLAHRDGDAQSNLGVPSRPRDKQIRLDVLRGSF